MPRRIKEKKPTKFEDLDPRTQEFLEKRGTKSGGRKTNSFDPSKDPKTDSPMAPEKTQPLAKGGRAGFKSGSKGCKLATKGKGRAYGKNS